MVTPSNVLLLLVVRTVPSLLTSVPFLMVPLRLLRPPVPNSPALPMSSVLPVLSRVPVRFTVLPAVRLKCVEPVRSATVNALPRFRMPLLRLILPGLLQLVGVMFSVPPLSFAVPLLVKVVGLTFIVPAVTLSVPVAALVKVLGLMLKLCPAVLPMSVPALMMGLPPQFCVRVPYPCSVTPLSICSVWPFDAYMRIVPPALLRVELPSVARWCTVLPDSPVL